jgi:hypothetical protein
LTTDAINRLVKRIAERAAFLTRLRRIRLADSALWIFRPNDLMA